MRRLSAAIPLLALLGACGDGNHESPGGTGPPAPVGTHEQTVPAPPAAQAPTPTSWVPYRDELEPFLEAPYLEEPLQRRARDTHRALSLLAGLHEGRVPPNLLVLAMELWRELERHRQSWERARANLPLASIDAWKLLLPAYARESLTTAREILEHRLAGSPVTAAALAERLEPIKELRFDVITAPPGVFCIESNAGWDELTQARERARTLIELHRAFQRELPGTVALEDEPLALLVLRNWRTYQHILLGRLAPDEIPTRKEAWYDPSRGIIVLLGDASGQDLLYATARALLDRAVVGEPEDPWVRISWLREGIALWFASARRTLDPESGSWTYDFGIIDGAGPLSASMHLEADTRASLEIPGLLTTSYVELAEGVLSRVWIAKPDPFEAARRWFHGELSGFPQKKPAKPVVPEQRRHALLYADDILGWHLFTTRALLLVHFLRDFEMDTEERVLISAAGEVPVPGRYRSRWSAFLLEALRGRDDIDTFRATLGLEDAADFKAFGQLFSRYERWIASKLALGHVASGRLIPHDRYVNRRGDTSGRPGDDVLPR